MKLAVEAFENAMVSEFTTIEFDKDTVEYTSKCIRYAALLHDIGHPPFSHIGEFFYDKEDIINDLNKFIHGKLCIEHIKYSRHPAELMSALVIYEFFDEILERLEVATEDVVAIILGLNRGKNLDSSILRLASSIIDSPIDVDKLDYVLRDCLISGAQLSTIDMQRLLLSFCVSEDGALAVSRKGLSAVLSLINGRESLYRWVYQHHTVCFSDTVMKRIIHFLPIEKRQHIFSKEGIKDLCDDITLISYIRKCKDPHVQNLWSYLKERKFLKPLWKDIQEFYAMFSPNTAEELKRIAYHPKVGDIVFEKFLQEKLNLQDKLIICSRSFNPYDPEKDRQIIIVYQPGKSRIITDYFPHLMMKRIPSLSFYIYTRPKDRQKVIDRLKETSLNEVMDYAEEIEYNGHNSFN